MVTYIMLKSKTNKINRGETIGIEQELTSDACFSLNKQTFSKICVFKSNVTCVTELFLYNSRTDGPEITPPDSTVQGTRINSYGIRCHHKQELFSQLRLKTTTRYCLITY